MNSRRACGSGAIAELSLSELGSHGEYQVTTDCSRFGSDSRLA